MTRCTPAPPEPLVAPARVSYLALSLDPTQREQGWAAIHDLAGRYGVAPPAAGANHYSADLGPFRVKWERHTEFLRYTFIVPGADADPFADPAINAVPADWLAALPGALMVAAHVALLPPTHPLADPDADPVELATRVFPRSQLVGSAVTGGAALAFTDFRVQPDGFSRLLDAGPRPHALAGRAGGAAAAGDRHLPHHGAAGAAGGAGAGAGDRALRAGGGGDHGGDGDGRGRGRARAAGPAHAARRRDRQPAGGQPVSVQRRGRV